MLFILFLSKLLTAKLKDGLVRTIKMLAMSFFYICFLCKCSKFFDVKMNTFLILKKCFVLKLSWGRRN